MTPEGANKNNNIAGVLLAGGLARRMGGGDKCLMSIGDKPLLEHMIERAQSQVGPLMINANGDPDRFQSYGLPVRKDVLDGYQGPLAGVLTGMEWVAEEHPDIEWMASFATDAPFIPPELVSYLMKAVIDADADMACAITNGRTHPVFALWPVRLKDDLHRAMVEEEMRKIDRWTARYNIIYVEFDTDPLDPFFNVNRPENLAEAEELLDIFLKGNA